jgi:hypothetical protein
VRRSLRGRFRRTASAAKAVHDEAVTDTAVALLPEELEVPGSDDRLLTPADPSLLIKSAKEV